MYNPAANYDVVAFNSVEFVNSSLTVYDVSGLLCFVQLLMRGRKVIWGRQPKRVLLGLVITFRGGAALCEVCPTPNWNIQGQDAV